MVRVSNYEVSKYKTLQAALNIQFQAAFFLLLALYDVIPHLRSVTSSKLNPRS